MMDSPRQGLERPIQIYRVIRPSGVRGRFQAAIAAGGLTSFVGREDELRSLMNRWESMNARAPLDRVLPSMRSNLEVHDSTKRHSARWRRFI